MTRKASINAEYRYDFFIIFLIHSSNLRTCNLWMKNNCTHKYTSIYRDNCIYKYCIYICIYTYIRIYEYVYVATVYTSTGVYMEVTIYTSIGVHWEGLVGEWGEGRLLFQFF